MFNETYTFADLLMIPRYSEVPSRSKVSLEVDLGKWKFSHPFIPANMATVFEKDMARKVFETKGLGFIHRFCSESDQLKIIEDLVEESGSDVWNHIGLSIGCKESDYKNLEWFVSKGLKLVCVDIAHGHSKMCIDMCKHIKEKYKELLLVAGNVATSEGAIALWEAGADIVKVGIGSSGICSTRLETGVGVTQLSAIMDCAKFKPEGKFLISDGGVTNHADIAKSLCFADMVMMGNMFAGIFETPGNIHFDQNGVKYKRYDGSSTHKKDRVEGVQALVKYKGSFDDVFKLMFEGLQSTCSYQGVLNLNDLKRVARFNKISSSGIIESGIHDVKLFK